MILPILLATAVTTTGRFGDVEFSLSVAGERAVFDFVVDDGDPQEAIASARKLADAGKEVWRADGIEFIIGNPDARVQFACDFLGRTYADTAGANPRCDVSVEGVKLQICYVIPLSVLPRCADGDLESRANFLRKKRGKVQAWRPGYGSMENAGVIAYAAADEVKAYRLNQGKRRLEHAARLAALREEVVGEICAMPRLADPETMARIPDAWRPAKICGKDYRFLVPSQLVSSFEKFRLTDTALFSDAMLWMQWRHVAPTAYEAGGSATELLARYPDKPFVVKTLDFDRPLTHEQKNRSDVKAFFDKPFMDSIFERWGDRFVGFGEDEAFVCGTGRFHRTIDMLGMSLPTTREEAYDRFRRCYEYQTNDVPDVAPFRNMANVTPFARGRVVSCSAATFNQFIAAQGDRMAGNETGDCMGPQAEKFAFARGSARQHGIPWRNYQTYYSWSRVVTPDGKQSGGLRTVYAYDELVSPKCRVAKYGHLNSPTWGTDKPRRKNFMFHPYFAGAGVWSSEAVVVELFGHFEESEVKAVDPAVLAMRDVKTLPSPLLNDHLRFWDEIVRRRDRGVQVTPIAFVWDRAHGYAPLYFHNRVWDSFPPSELEKSMWATCRHVFRCNDDNSACDTSRWGDVFDMVTNDADAEFLANYRVLWPIGDVTLDEVFAAKVRMAVERGATFVVNAELLARYPKAFKEDFLGCRLTGTHGRSPSTWLIGEKREVSEKYAYSYRVVEVAGAQVLAVTTDGKASPAMTLHRYGKGRVVVTMPANLKVPGSFTTMLNLFDELMTNVRADVLPIRVETTAEYGVAFNGKSWVFHLNNNAGATPRNGLAPKPVETDVTKTAEVKIFFPEPLGRFEESLDWWTGERNPLSRELVDGRWHRVFRTVLPGGDSALIEFIQSDGR